MKNNLDKLKFLGLDLSLAGTGICIIDGYGKIKHITSVSTERIGDLLDERFIRYRELILKLKPFIGKECKYNTVSVESISFGSKGHRRDQLVESAALVKYILLKNSNRVLEVAPQSLKKFIIGDISIKDRPKGKDAKGLLCREVYKKFGKDINDNNQIDAFILAHVSRLFWARVIKNHQRAKSTWAEYKRYQREVVDNLYKKIKEASNATN